MKVNKKRDGGKTAEKDLQSKRSHTERAEKYDRG